MKNKIIAILSAIIIIFGGGYGVSQLGGGQFISGEVLVGSSDNLKSLPNEAVFNNSTTTDSSYYTDGGATIDQVVNTEKINKVLLNIQALGGTATSTIYLRQMGSYDGTYFFDLATSSEDYIGKVASSTLASLPIRSWSWDPGLATSSVSIPFNTDGHRYSRFIMWAEDASTDPNDGIQAWINAVRIEPLTR